MGSLKNGGKFCNITMISVLFWKLSLRTNIVLDYFVLKRTKQNIYHTVRVYDKYVKGI
jgi:hypothetical protein